MEKKAVAALSFLFLVLFVAQEIAVSEAKTCENLSGTFKGPCIPDGSTDWGEVLPPANLEKENEFLKGEHGVPSELAAKVTILERSMAKKEKTLREVQVYLAKVDTKLEEAQETLDFFFFQGHRE
ncbi:hypothetical protein KIW84_056823 [Lathyrus oleraceus]|uniref:Uncharacterized protein n=1 Tax=Pisum sativum TaxID=3888 RepID=A0A9D4X2I8_PEA|nr:hypothetical protein KIW84_056823 [Pisum sativum]